MGASYENGEQPKNIRKWRSSPIGHDTKMLHLALLLKVHDWDLPNCHRDTCLFLEWIWCSCVNLLASNWLVRIFTSLRLFVRIWRVGDFDNFGPGRQKKRIPAPYGSLSREPYIWNYGR